MQCFFFFFFVSSAATATHQQQAHPRALPLPPPLTFFDRQPGDVDVAALHHGLRGECETGDEGGERGEPDAQRGLLFDFLTFLHLRLQVCGGTVNGFAMVCCNTADGTRAIEKGWRRAGGRRWKRFCERRVVTLAPTPFDLFLPPPPSPPPSSLPVKRVQAVRRMHAKQQTAL